VILADRGENAEFPNSSENVAGGVGATWGVAHVFGQLFLAAIWSEDAGFDHDSGHFRNNCSPKQCSCAIEQLLLFTSPRNGELGLRVSSLAGHGDADRVLRFHKVIDAFGGVSDGKLNSPDSAVKFVPARTVVRRNG
jgi:hypothetical protein